MLHKTLNIRGTLTSLDTPLVMGILNVTPDSFYADSRKQTEVAIEERIQAILSEGGRIIDLGGYSSRPDAAEVSPRKVGRRSKLFSILLDPDRASEAKSKAKSQIIPTAANIFR